VRRLDASLVMVFLFSVRIAVLVTVEIAIKFSGQVDQLPG
jgi:hypothetical protein